MQFEVDYLSVGNGETSGDAIGIRFGDLSSGDLNRQWVVVVDGGFKETGEAFINHIIDIYGTRTIDLMVSTHPDRDHASGLSVVLENMDVRELLMHKPWEHSIEQKNWNNEQLLEKVGKAYSHVLTLNDLAAKKGINVTEPFAGTTYNPTVGAVMTVLGPSIEYYQSLLSSFEHNKTAETIFREMLEKAQGRLSALAKQVRESLDPNSETLDHVHKNTSPENNSSAILHFNFNGQTLLLTGDAGVESLNLAADFADSQGIDLSRLSLFGIPHHGSKHSLNGPLLDRIRASSAFVSATEDSKKHPSQRVINALCRRGFRVFTTEKSGIRHHHNVGPRPGWSRATPRQLVEEFSEDD